MHIVIPPKFAVAQVFGYSKGKNAIQIVRTFDKRTRDFIEENFWAGGYFASTVGRGAKGIRKYIQDQEREDRRVDQLKRLK